MSEREEVLVLGCDEYPALTFRPEEWRMPSSDEMAGKLWSLVRVKADLDRRADALMSAVRAVARGS